MPAYTPFDFTKITEYINTMASDAEKIAVKELIDIYLDDWKDQVYEELGRQFSTKVRDKLYHLITTEYNILKRVTNEISLVYKNKAERAAVLQDEIKNEDGSIENKLDENYEDMIKASNIDPVMKAVNHYTTFLNQVVVRPVVRNGVMDYDMFTLDTIDIITDPLDWKRMVAVKYYVGMDLPNTGDVSYNKDAADRKASPTARPTGEGVSDICTSQYTLAYLWVIEDFEEKDTDDEGHDITRTYKKGMVYKMKRFAGKDQVIDSGEEIQYKDKDGNVILPFVIFWKTYPVRELIDTTSGTDLKDATIRMAVNMSHLQYLIKFQSYKVGQISTRDASKLSGDHTIDPGYLYVNEDSEGNSKGLEVVDFQSNIKELWDTLNSQITAFLSNYHISPANFTLSGTPQSGYTMQISNQAKLEYREDQIDIYREREHELFRVSRIVWNTDVSDKAINEEAEFAIDFAEITFPLSPDEKSQSFTFLKQNNAVTDINLIMERNPDLSEEDAIMLYNKNKAFNASQKVSLEPPQIPPTNTPPQDDDE